MRVISLGTTLCSASKEEKEERVALRGRKGKRERGADGRGKLKWTQVAPPPPPLRDWMKLQIEILDVRAQRTHRQTDGEDGAGERTQRRRRGRGRGRRERGRQGNPPSGRSGGRAAGRREGTSSVVFGTQEGRKDGGGRTGGRKRERRRREEVHPPALFKTQEAVKTNTDYTTHWGQMVGLALAHIGRTWKGEIVAPNADDVPLHDDCEEFGRMIVNKHLALF